MIGKSPPVISELSELSVKAFYLTRLRMLAVGED